MGWTFLGKRKLRFFVFILRFLSNLRLNLNLLVRLHPSLKAFLLLLIQNKCMCIQILAIHGLETTAHCNFNFCIRPLLVSIWTVIAIIWCHQGEGLRSADLLRFLLNWCPVLRYYYSHAPTLKPFPWLWSMISASTGWHLCALISWNKPLHKHDICQQKYYTSK